MGLFGKGKSKGRKDNQVAAVTTQDCKQMVESFLEKVGLDPKEQRLPDRRTLGWCVHRGSAVVFIVLEEQNSYPTLRIVSPILYLPEGRILALYRKCLEINMGLINCALGVFEDRIAVVSERPIASLDPAEFEERLNYLSAVADDLDEKLSQEFDAKPYGEM